MKKLVLVLLFFLMAFSAASQVNYDIKADAEKVKFNLSAGLECQETEDRCPVNRWRLEWKIPEDAEILNISDSQGAIQEYTVRDRIIDLETNKGPKRTSEKIKIEMSIDEKAEQITEGLYQRQISLPSIPDKQTSGEVHAENILSGTVTRGFEKTISNKSLIFKGLGATNIRFNFGKGSRKGNYVFFGQPEGNTSLAYRTAVATTGLRQSYPAIPVAVLQEDSYVSKASEWSQGEYSGGVIRIRENLEEGFSAVLVEETVHAFNDEALSFDRTSSSWLDEGIAGYTQSLMRKRLFGTDKGREIFGENNSYTEQKAGGFYEVTKFSKGNKEKLWSYYQNDSEFMKSWSPQKSQNRDFGYAYSELIIRNYVSQNNSVRGLYSSIDPEELDNNDQKWKFYSEYLDLEPCNYQSREKFESCLERINNYDYPVYYVNMLPKRQSADVNVQEIEVPNQTSEKYYRNTELYQEGFAHSLAIYLESLLGSIRGLI